MRPTVFLVALFLLAPGLRAVTPVPVGALLQHKAHYFDLEHKRLRFVPRSAAAYELTVTSSRALDRGAPIGKPTDPHGYSWRTRLPFPYPFAGKSWDELYINLNGNLTFGAPETTAYPERDTWPEGTMRSLASAFDTRAIAGERRMIVPFWGLNSAGTTRIFTRSSRAAFTVTWQAVRYQSPNEAYTPLGESVFQVRLGRDGSIEFRYGDVAEKDGIAGIFCGAAPIGKPLDHVDLPPAANISPALDLRRADLDDRGADLHFSLSLAGEVPSKPAAGRLSYRVIAMSRGEAYVTMLTVDSAGNKSSAFCVVINPQDQVVPTDCSAKTIAIAAGHTVEFYLPKIALKDPASLEWKGDIVEGDGQDPSVSTGELRAVSLVPMPSGFDFTRGIHLTAGSLYEIFHYPFLSKSREPTFQEIYKHAAAEDDLAIAVTDFRIDDIYNHGTSNSAGDDIGHSREMFNSSALQHAAGPVYLGPRFREVVQEGGRTFRNYAFAVGWMAHEMTHRWVATLRWKDPDASALLNTIENYHWSHFLNTPAVTPVWPLFSDSPYPEASIMGGMTVEKMPDGTVQSSKALGGPATGLCALDLYSMGLIGPEEVPDTFFISGATKTEDGGHKGGDFVPVRIADIVAVNGPRTPPAKDAQHRFRFEIYLLHEEGREPDPSKLAQARGIQSALIRYFDLATNGRMTVLQTR